MQQISIGDFETYRKSCFDSSWRYYFKNVNYYCPQKSVEMRLGVNSKFDAEIKNSCTVLSNKKCNCNSCRWLGLRKNVFSLIEHISIIEHCGQDIEKNPTNALMNL